MNCTSCDQVEGRVRRRGGIDWNCSAAWRRQGEFQASNAMLAMPSGHSQTKTGRLVEFRLRASDACVECCQWLKRRQNQILSRLNETSVLSWKSDCCKIHTAKTHAACLLLSSLIVVSCAAGGPKLTLLKPLDLCLGGPSRSSPDYLWDLLGPIGGVSWLGRLTLFTFEKRREACVCGTSLTLRID